MYRVGDNVTFTCSEGFKLDGAQQITCGPGGQWQPQPPRCPPSHDKTPSLDKDSESAFLLDCSYNKLSLSNCLHFSSVGAICSAGGCGVPVNVRDSNANLADKYITMTAFASGDRVHYVCDVGYIQAGGSRYRKCVEGRWTPLLLRCERENFSSPLHCLKLQQMLFCITEGL